MGCDASYRCLEVLSYKLHPKEQTSVEMAAQLGISHLQPVIVNVPDRALSTGS